MWSRVNDEKASYNAMHTVPQGLIQPKVSGYRNFSIGTFLCYSYVTFVMCAEIVDAPSYIVLDLEWGLNLLKLLYARSCILLP